MSNDDLDPMKDDDSGDELEASGMHLVSDEAGDDENEAEAPKAAVVSTVIEEDEAPKDGLAELEELEKSLEADRNATDEEEEEI
jgi:hypothetical protein